MQMSVPSNPLVEKIGKIGSGAYSQVYKCYYTPDPSSFPKEVCAVKYVPSDSYGVSCVNELVIMSSFVHANIMTAKCVWCDYVDDIAADAPTMVIVMDLAECSLENYKSTMEDIRNMTRDVLNGIKVLHDAGYIHGDLKPSNILKCKTGYKITDFSITTTNIVKNQGRICTYPYRPPEAFGTSRSWNEKVDIWALGATLFELVFGRRLFPAQSSSGGEAEVEPKMLNAIADWADDTGQPHSIVKTDVEYNTYYRSSRFFDDPNYRVVADFIRLCCQINPSERPSPSELLNHRFLRGCSTTLVYDIVQYSEISTLTEKALELLIDYGRRYSLPTIIIGYAAKLAMITQALTSRYAPDILVKVVYLLTLKIFNHSKLRSFCEDNYTSELYQKEIDLLARLRYTLPIPRSVESAS